MRPFTDTTRFIMQHRDLEPEAVVTLGAKHGLRFEREAVLDTRSRLRGRQVPPWGPVKSTAPAAPARAPAPARARAGTAATRSGDLDAELERLVWRIGTERALRVIERMTQPK